MKTAALVCLLFSVYANANELNWRSSLATESIYNENWILAVDAGDDLASWSSRNRAQVSMSYETPRDLLQLNANVVRQIFDNNRLPDLDNFAADISWLRAKPRGGSSVSASYQKTSSLLTAFDLDGQVSVDDDEARSAVSVSEFRELNETSIGSITLEARRVEFDDDNLLVQRSDIETYSLALARQTQYSERATLTLSLLVDVVDSRAEFPSFVGVFLVPTSQRSESLLYGPGLAFDYLLSSYWQVQVSANLRRREDRFSAENVLGSNVQRVSELDYFGGVQATRELPMGSLQLSVTRSFRPSQSSFVQITTRDVASLSWTRQLSERLRLESRMSWFRDEREGAASGDRNAWEALISMRWNVGRRLSLSGYYQYQNQSLSASDDFDVERNVFALRLRYQFGTDR